MADKMVRTPQSSEQYDDKEKKKGEKSESEQVGLWESNRVGGLVNLLIFETIWYTWYINVYLYTW